MSPNLDITYFAKINFRRDERLFGINQADRLLHTYLLGKTGTGKTSCLETQIMQDIYANRGLCLLDPHGDLAESVYQNIPKEREQDVIYFNITDSKLKLRYNPLKRVSYEKRSLVASSILEALEKLWHKAWGVKLEHILRQCLLTLLDQPSSSIADIPKLLQDRSFRKAALPRIVNPDIKRFWTKEFPYYWRNELLPVLNKVGGMLSHPAIRRVLIDNTQEVSLRKAMDEKKIIIVNLSKGHLGEDVANILGALMITSLSSAAFSRVDTPEELRIPFMIYADEFQSFSTLSLINMMSELRKYKVGMILSNQYLHQLDEKIKWAILGNVGTIISFRIGTDDAIQIAREMYPVFDVEDLIRLPNYDIILKIMIDGCPSKPFSATTIQAKELVYNDLISMSQSGNGATSSTD